jgi:hypothetical protein
MKPPKEQGDSGLDIQQDQPQTAAPISPAKMSSARDTSDGTGSTTKKDLTHADQQPSKAKKMPTLEVPDDMASITDEKHLPKSTAVSSDGHIDLPDKATDGTSSDSDRPRSEDFVSSANGLGSLNNSAGTSLLPEEHSQAGKSISSARTSQTSGKAKNPSFLNGHHLHGGAASSLANNVQGGAEFNDTSILGSRKRKNVQSSVHGEVAESQEKQDGDKGSRSSTTSAMSTATKKAKIDTRTATSKTDESPKSPKQSKRKSRLNPSASTKGFPTPRKETVRAEEAPSQVQTQQAPAFYVSPLDRKINALEALVGVNGRSGLCCETAPLANQLKLQLQECIADLDLSALEPILKQFPPGKSDRNTLLTSEALLLLFASNDIAPVLKQCKETCFDNTNMEDSILFALQETVSPWNKEAEVHASCAMFYSQIEAKKMEFKHKHRDAMMACAMFVRRLVFCMSSYIITQFLDKCMFPDMDRFLFEFGARILLTAYDDLLNNEGGFFTKLLNSPFGAGITSDVRPLWAGHLGLAGTDKDMHQWDSLNPSINVQRAALSFGAAMKSKIKQKQKSSTYDNKLLVKQTLYASSASLTDVINQFQEQADCYPDLLVAIGNHPAISDLPKEVPKKIENHKAMCTVKPTCSVKHKRATPLQDNDAVPSVPTVPTVPNPDEDALPKKLVTGQEYFSQSDGRIIPCRALVDEVGNPDPFTKREELILYKRYKAVVTVDFIEGGPKNSSKAWWEQWAKVAEVLPGRSVLDCIAYYSANKEHFQRE